MPPLRKKSSKESSLDDPLAMPIEVTIEEFTDCNGYKETVKISQGNGSDSAPPPLQRMQCYQSVKRSEAELLRSPPPLKYIGPNATTSKHPVFLHCSIDNGPTSDNQVESLTESEKEIKKEYTSVICVNLSEDVEEVEYGSGNGVKGVGDNYYAEATTEEDTDYEDATHSRNNPQQHEEEKDTESSIVYDACPYERTAPAYDPCNDDEDDESDRKHSVTLDTLQQQRLRPYNRMGLGHRYLGNPVDDPADAISDSAAEVIGKARRKRRAAAAAAATDSDSSYLEPDHSDSSLSAFSSSSSSSSSVQYIPPKLSRAPRVVLKQRKEAMWESSLKPTCFGKCPDPGVILTSSGGPSIKLGEGLICERCGQRFLCTYHLSIHRTVHGYRFACTICHSRFPEVHNADVHYRYKHCDTQDRFKCVICNNTNQTPLNWSTDAHFTECYAREKKKKKPKLHILEVQSDSD